MNIEEIKEWKTYQVEERHSQRLAEQRKDQDFYENEYPLKLIKKVDYQMRTNFSARMINGITQQLISNLPKAYVKAKADTTVSGESSKKVASAFNHWVELLLNLPINIFEEAFKNYNVRGENWLYTPHNAMIANYEGDWRKDFPDVLPLHFILYDPLVVFSEPTEEADGEPSRVAVSYKRPVSDILRHYPKWTNKNNRKSYDQAEFFLYFDNEMSYAEADDEPLFRNKKGKLLNGGGERKNPYGCVPFTHLYSGWGKTTSEMKPDLLAYSRIRMLRELITEDSQVRSDMLYNFHGFAHRSKTLYVPAGGEVAPGWKESYKNDPDKLNVIYLPEGANPGWFKADESLLFDAPAFAYADRVRADLAQEYPSPLRGGTGTSSGREADILRGAGLSIYDCAVENTAKLFERGFAKALKVCEAVDRLPRGLVADDLERYTNIEVDLRTDDPVSRDRLINMGSTLVNEKKRSLKTFLIKDMRMTEDEAEEEIDRILEEMVTINSPDVAEFLGFKAAQKAGMAEELAAWKEVRAGGGINTGSQIGSRGGEPRRGNIRTDTGREQVDVALTSTGQRRPPMG